MVEVASTFARAAALLRDSISLAPAVSSLWGKRRAGQGGGDDGEGDAPAVDRNRIAA